MSGDSLVPNVNNKISYVNFQKGISKVYLKVMERILVEIKNEKQWITWKPTKDGKFSLKSANYDSLT